MAKSPDAFRTISEVAEWLDVPTHVLRFWESRFTQVKPVKRAGGRRYYRPSDMELLGGIKRLLHDDGLTIRGVQKLLREEGVRHVAALSPPRDPDEPDGQPTNVVELRHREAPMPEEVDLDAPEDAAPAQPAAPEEPPVTEADLLRDAPPAREHAPLAQPPLLDESAIYVVTPGPLARLVRLGSEIVRADRDVVDNAIDRARALRDAMGRTDG